MHLFSANAHNLMLDFFLDIDPVEYKKNQAEMSMKQNTKVAIISLIRWQNYICIFWEMELTK